MKQVLQNLKSGHLGTEEVPSPLCRPGGLLIRVRYSLISAGTERSKIEVARAGYIGKARKKPEQLRKVIDAVKKDGFVATYRKVIDRLDSLSPLGYSAAGDVVEVGANVRGFNVGDRVACAGAEYAFHSEYDFVPQNLCARIPDNVSYEQASFTTLGAIAMQGFRQAEVGLGDRVLVIGLGLIGQLTVGLIRASGGIAYGIDIDQRTCERAVLSGAFEVSARNDPGLFERIMSFTDNHGVDSVIITAATPSNDPIEFAGKVCRDRGKVVVVGAVRTDLPREDYYRKELELRFSRSYGPGRYDPLFEERGMAYPIGYIRWTENRNMKEFLRLISHGAIQIEHLISHRFTVDEAERAYDVVSGDSHEDCVAVTLKYDSEDISLRRLKLPAVSPTRSSEKMEIVRVGFIGGGNFARSMLLPHLKSADGVVCEGVACLTGSSARDAARKFNFNYFTSNPFEIIDNESIDVVMIATRHDSHAQLVARALAKGKIAYVEKPLAINRDELEQIISTIQQTNGQLMVGFNRRFSQAAVAAEEYLRKLAPPFNIIYRINAGKLPLNHWVHNDEQGGGRIIGEVCHFVDLCRYFVGAPIRAVSGFDSANCGEDPHYAENGAFALKFDDGSVASIVYSPFGASGMGKERIEVMAGGTGVMIDDFKSIELIAKDKSYRRRFSGDLKGHASEVHSFLKAVKENRPLPIDIDDIINVTKASIQIAELGRISGGIPL